MVKNRCTPASPYRTTWDSAGNTACGSWAPRRPWSRVVKGNSTTASAASRRSASIARSRTPGRAGAGAREVVAVGLVTAFERNAPSWSSPGQDLDAGAERYRQIDQLHAEAWNRR